MSSSNFKYPNEKETAQVSRKAVCDHCSLPVSPKDATADENGKVFCCNGCAFVFKMIHSSGLGDFYRLKSSSSDTPDSPPTPGESEFTYMDSETFFSNYVSQDQGDELAEFSLLLSGVHCAACIWLLESTPSVLDGLAHVRVDFTRSRARIGFNPKIVDPSDIARLFDSLGYTPRIPSSDQEVANRNASDRSFLIKLGVAGFCAGNTMLLAVSLYQGFYTGIEPRFRTFLSIVSFLIAIPAVTYSATPFYRAALNSFRMKTAHIDLPISIAILAGFAASTFNLLQGQEHIYFDSICMLIFLLLTGRWIQRRALQRALNSLEELPDFLPSVAQKESNGNFEEVLIEEISPGDTVFIPKGSVVPADGLVLRGESHVDVSVITGESLPVAVAAGSSLVAGSLNVSDPIVAEVSATGEQTRIGKLLEQIKAAGESKTAISDLTAKLSSTFVVVVLFLASATFLWWFSSGFQVALDHTLALLIVTCPCALGLAVPITLSVATSRAASAGILIKSHHAIESLCKVRHFYFDKTGTITTGMPQVKHGCDATVFKAQGFCNTEGISPDYLKMAYLLEGHSSHPYAISLREYCSSNLHGDSLLTNAAVELKEIPGKGVEAKDSSDTYWRIGSLRYLDESGVDLNLATGFVDYCNAEKLTPVGLSKGSSLCVLFALSDGLKPGVTALFSALREKGKILYLLSGDMKAPVEAVAEQTGIPATNTFSQCTPEEKLQIVASSAESTATAMIGDGINDAAALSAATVGIGVRGGAEACLAAADIFVMSSDCARLNTLFSGATATMRIIKRNLFFSVFYNTVGASLAFCGLVTPLLAAILMPLSSLTVIATSILSSSFVPADRK